MADREGQGERVAEIFSAFAQWFARWWIVLALAITLIGAWDARSAGNDVAAILLVMLAAINYGLAATMRGWRIWRL